MVEHNLAKVGVASSSLVFRSMPAQVAELVDAHVSGACVERRAGSTPVLGTNAFATEMERWRNGRRAALRWQCREAWEFESPPLHFQCGNSSVGRAQPCQGWGREFEPRFPLNVCPSGGIGRRARFRCVCREACRFDSCLGHKHKIRYSFEYRIFLLHLLLQ